MSPSNSPRLRSRGHSRPSDECRLPTLRTRSQERVLFAEPEVRSEARSRDPGGAFHGWLPERVPCSQGNHAIWASYAHSTNGLSASRYWLNASNDGTACNVVETCSASPPADLWWTISIFNPGKRAMAGFAVGFLILIVSSRRLRLREFASLAHVHDSERAARPKCRPECRQPR